jgi:YhcH/YjgK/YiaL family protein
MVFDKIENYNHYVPCHKRFEKAFRFLIETDFEKLEAGKYAIEGDSIYAIYQTYQSKDESECRLESHQEYIDIQYIVAGSEKMGFAIFNNQQVTESIPENDVSFYLGEVNTLVLEKGTFTIFFPHDLHKPGMCADFKETVRKVVVKIRV